MKFKKSKVEQIVREELGAHLRELLHTEADKDEKDKKPNTVGADGDNEDQEPSGAASSNTAPKVGSEKEPEMPDGDQEAPEDSPTDDEESGEEEVPTGDDPSDDELSQDVEEPESEDELGGDISDEVTGKTIQSITMEPESKMMPGASELTIQFEEIPHPLKIIIGKSGMIKYHFKGGLHNEL